LDCQFGNLAPGAQAIVHIQSPTTAPPGSSAGTYTNQAGTFADNSPVKSSNVASITVNAAPPTVKKAFGASTIPLNGSTSVSFTVTNPNGSALTSVSLTDTLPPGLVVSTPNGLTTTCSGTITATAGSNSINLSGGSLAASGSCAFSVSVTGIAPGMQNNTTGPISSNESGPGATSNTASLTVVAPPTITKAFGALAIRVGGSTSLTLVITNPNPAVSLTVSFNDTLSPGLVVSTPNGATTTCAGGIITATPGSNSISLAGASLGATASCTVIVNVTGTSETSAINAVTVTSIEGGTGNTAMARLAVGSPFQVTYLSNLDKGDSVLNITNAGTAGNLCVNVYAFSPDEQLVSCCSCAVTPNGLVSLSANSDLVSNTLTPAHPTSIAVKLVATDNTVACNAATAPAATSLGLGLRAWGTTLHSLPTSPVTVGLTEREFSPAGLSAAELARITSLCGFIQANGSGFGICKSCRQGGLGALTQ
jgi:hypothetical protein